MDRGLSDWIEVLLCYAANRASPILGDILERRSGSDTAIGIADLRIIDPSTYCADILFHGNVFVLIGYVIIII